MVKQLTFPQTKKIIPPRPTIRSESVAYQIAKEIVETVNLDEVYWTADELNDRIFDVQHDIMENGNPADVFERLHRKSPFKTDEQRERVTAPYGWEGIDEHCRHIAGMIAEEKLVDAVDAWKERYS